MMDTRKGDLSMKKCTVILAILVLGLNLNAQWAKTYGGSEDDYPNSILQTSDGGYIIFGSTESFGFSNRYSDIWILKLNSLGDIEWQKTYGDHWGNPAYSIQKTTDGGYIFACHMPATSDFAFIKLSSNGDIEWKNIYGDNSVNRSYSFQQTVDGGYIVASTDWSSDLQMCDVSVLKLFFDGTVEWSKTYAGSGDERLFSIQQTFDGGYIVASYTNSYGAGSSDIWILKLASDGNIEWEKTYGGSQDEEASFIQQTIDGGYIVAGYTKTYGVGERDILILKFFPNGDLDSSCVFVKESSAEVSTADISSADSYIDSDDSDIISKDVEITTQESEAVVYSLCSGQHTLNLSASSGGTTAPPPGSYVYDHAERISLNANSGEGYNFIAWSGDVSSTASVSSTMNSRKYMLYYLHNQPRRIEYEEIYSNTHRR